MDGMGYARNFEFHQVSFPISPTHCLAHMAHQAATAVRGAGGSVWVFFISGNPEATRSNTKNNEKQSLQMSQKKSCYKSSFDQIYTP